ncbi:MAG TPA: hypothetical protein VIG33_04540 [Pseudobdellovibrionaceae bacterium]
MADVVGSVIAEKYIIENPFKNEEEKVAAIRFIDGCSLNNSVVKRPESLAPKTLETLFSSSSFSDSHPENSDRVKKIMLNLPGMAKIYDCQRKAPACFDHLSFSTRMGSAGASRNDSELRMQEGEK